MIILCEDNTDQRLALRLALEQATYSVREAANGREALDLQRKRPSPFVITDIFMPEADGFELVDAIKKEFPKTKVIVISAGGPKRTVDYLASARLIGVDATFEKPFKFESLLRRSSVSATEAWTLVARRRCKAGESATVAAG